MKEGKKKRVDLEKEIEDAKILSWVMETLGIENSSSQAHENLEEVFKEMERNASTEIRVNFGGDLHTMTERALGILASKKILAGVENLCFMFTKANSKNDIETEIVHAIQLLVLLEMDGLINVND